MSALCVCVCMLCACCLRACVCVCVCVLCANYESNYRVYICNNVARVRFLLKWSKDDETGLNSNSSSRVFTNPNFSISVSECYVIRTVVWLYRLLSCDNYVKISRTVVPVCKTGYCSSNTHLGGLSKLLLEKLASL